MADHCHITGSYRGAAHQDCNLQYSLRYLRIPCVLHNFRGYDSKYIVQALSSYLAERIEIIAENSEKFKSITLDGKVRFFDSLQHLPSSLDALVKNVLTGSGSLDEKKARLVHLTNHYKDLDDEKFVLLLRKGVFPYAFMDSLGKLRMTTLPTYEDFYDTLKNENISIEDYNHAKSVWDTFEITSMRNYTKLYLKLDVLLLADIIENYRSLALKEYSLDPLRYFTSPALTLDAALLKTGIELDLLTDIEMLHFFQKGIRGGLSYVAKRKSEVRENQHIGYYDANNLYGGAMANYAMPVGEYAWVEDWTRPAGIRDVIDLQRETYNYVLEVDATFPVQIHDRMTDFPLLPELWTPPGSQFEKLVNHLLERKKYVLSFEMFLLAEREGIIFTKIHRVLRYKQAQWMRSYIDLNTELRRQATTPFAQDFFKLMNNSLYGKMMEDVLKRVNLDLYNNQNTAKYIKLLVKQPYRVKRRIVYRRCPEHDTPRQDFSDDDDDEDPDECTDGDTCLIALEKFKKRILFDKPIPVGFKVLEMVKLIMFDVYYGVLKKQFGDRISLLAHDTDSFIVEIRSSHFQDEIRAVNQHFDLSNYPTDHPLYDATNKRVPGKLKDEFPNARILSFVGLRSKCYAFTTEDGKCTKKAKGVSKAVVKKSLHFDDYERCLLQDEDVYREVTQLRSINQTIFTVKQTKLALSNRDDKRWIDEDKISTLPWGHYRITGNLALP